MMGAISYGPGPVDPNAVPKEISDRQFFQGLAERDLISWEEFHEAVGPGVIPAPMMELVNQLPEGEDGNDRNRAIGLLRGATTFVRDNPLAALIGQLYGWDDAALDEFWRFASTL